MGTDGGEVGRAVTPSDLLEEALYEMRLHAHALLDAADAIAVKLEREQ